MAETAAWDAQVLAAAPLRGPSGTCWELSVVGRGQPHSCLGDGSSTAGASLERGAGGKGGKKGWREAGGDKGSRGEEGEGGVGGIGEGRELHREEDKGKEEYKQRAVAVGREGSGQCWRE